MTVSVFRPVKGSLVVRVPFRNGGDNYAMLHEICGSRTRVRYSKESGGFEIAPSHLQLLIDGLLDRFAELELVTQYYSQQTCVAQCWNASRTTAHQCVCGCAGQNHGTRRPFKTLILDGSVSVQGQYILRTQVIRRAS